jgi:hypothetical protein
MTHTPGPWVAQFNERNQRTKVGDWFFVQSNGSGNHNEIVRLTGTSKENKTAQANARLIAAAPDLLATLKALADAVANGAPTVPLMDAVGEARAAIAKAEGK